MGLRSLGITRSTGASHKPSCWLYASLAAAVSLCTGCSLDFDAPFEANAPDAPSDSGAGDGLVPTDGGNETGTNDGPLHDGPPDDGPLHDGPQEETSFVCPSGAKSCGGACVSMDDPAYGCGATSCTPCVLANAEPTCDKELRCAVAKCDGSWEDCNGDGDDGCEVDLDSTDTSCGACNRSCGSAPCVQGMCEPELLAPVQGEPGGLAVDDAFVYFVMARGGGNDIWRGDKASGDVVSVASVSMATTYLAVGDGFLYWVDPSQNRIYRMPTPSGNAQSVGPTIADMARIALGQDGSVYFTVKGTGTGYVARLDTATNDVANLATNQENPDGIAFKDGWVYWTNHYVGHVRRVPSSGGAAEDVSSSTGNFGDVAVSSSHVFWCDDNNSEIRWNDEPELLATPESVMNIAFDASAGNLYWVDEVTGEVFRFSEQGRDQLKLTTDMGCCAYDIGVDASWVYWTTMQGLMRVAK